MRTRDIDQLKLMHADKFFFFFFYFSSHLRLDGGYIHLVKYLLDCLVLPCHCQLVPSQIYPTRVGTALRSRYGHDSGVNCSFCGTLLRRSIIVGTDGQVIGDLRQWLIKGREYSASDISFTSTFPFPPLLNPPPMYLPPTLGC